jgi:hypothetical protein
MKINPKKIVFSLGFTILIFILFILVLNIFSYFDPFSFCYIKINYNVDGNKDTIKKAIEIIKNEDKKEYKKLCQYVNLIVERPCYSGRLGTSGMLRLNEDFVGCYIKGSKIIYLKPEKEDDFYVTKKRVGAIKKYSQKSQEFWGSFRK